ncbi:hypothetical protein [Acinetobacter pollinis]|nr:hypothetical protein [Acinetobacter pollinis]MBF7694166.1 hypothetical protein [Acinetobacter pollinis]MBF7701759.1 hypothetical protein [Acinetobacter pollinis]
MDYSLLLLGIVFGFIGYFLSKHIDKVWLSYKNAQVTSKKRSANENNR